jgi:hypothetical protein
MRKTIRRNATFAAHCDQFNRHQERNIINNRPLRSAALPALVTWTEMLGKILAWLNVNKKGRTLSMFWI